MRKAKELMRNKLISEQVSNPALNSPISARSSLASSPKVRLNWESSFTALLSFDQLLPCQMQITTSGNSLSASNSLIDSQVVSSIDIHSVYTHGAKILKYLMCARSRGPPSSSGKINNFSFFYFAYSTTKPIRHVI